MQSEMRVHNIAATIRIHIPKRVFINVRNASHFCTNLFFEFHQKDRNSVEGSNLKGRGDLSVDGSIILKRNLRQLCEKILTEFVLLK